MASGKEDLKRMWRRYSKMDESHLRKEKHDIKRTKPIWKSLHVGNPAAPHERMIAYQKKQEMAKKMK